MEDIIILQEESGKQREALNVKNSKSDYFSAIKEFFESFSHIKTKQKILFYRLLATMLNAGMTLVKSVWVLEKQEKSPLLKKILWEIMTGLKEWKNLSECLEMYPSSFSEAEIGIIRSGEKTGKLNDVMNSLADQVEKVASVTGKLKSALIYPSMIILVVIGVISVMMTAVVPKLLEIFQDKDSLPGSTKTLILVSDIFKNYWYVMLLFLIFVYFWISIWKKTPSWKYTFDSFLIKIPLFWIVIQKVILSKFARVFAGLMASGVSVVESLKIVADAVGNEAYKQRILLLLEDIRGWMKIWESLDTDPLFPDIMVQMIQVGEQSAKLDVTIVKVADFYDEQVDNIASTINKLIEPLIIVFLAIVVGFIALAIMQPIMNLSDTVSQG